MRNFKLPQSVILALFLFVNTLSFSNNFEVINSKTNSTIFDNPVVKSTEILSNLNTKSIVAPTITSEPIATNTVCAGGTITFSVVASGVGNLSYIWKKNNLALSNGVVVSGATTPDLKLTNVDSSDAASYTCVVTDDSDVSNPTTSNAATLTVNALPILTKSGITTICSGQSTTLSISGANTYSWSTLSTSSFIIINPTSNTTYTVTGTDSSNGCKKTETFTVQVNPLPTISISGTTTICSGTPTTLTASGAQTYDWGTGFQTNDSAVFFPTSNTVYAVTGKDSNGCDNSKSVTVTVNAIPIASVSATTSICSGSDASFTISGTPNATVVYKIGSGSNVNIVLNSSGSAVVNVLGATSDQTLSLVSVTLLGCQSTTFTPSSVTVNVNPIPLAPTTSPVSYCQNGTATALTASGTSPLKWYLSQTGGSAETSVPIPSTLTTGIFTYYVSQTLNGCESQRASLVVTVKSLPSLPTVNSPINYCVGETPSVILATGTALQWYTIATSGTASSIAPTPSTSIVTEINYFVSQTVNGCEGLRANIKVIVNAIPANPTTPYTSPITYCQNQTASPLLATGNSLKWYSGGSGGSGSATPPTPSTTTPGTASYFVSQTINGCESGRTQIDVLVNPTPLAPSVNSPLPYCLNDIAPVLSTATVTGNTIKWYISSSGGSALPNAPSPGTNASGTTLYYVSETNNTYSCESPRSLISVMVNELPNPPVVTPTVSYCKDASASSLSATATSGHTLKWYTVASSGIATTSITPNTNSEGTLTYYVSQVNPATGCESARASIDVTVKSIPSIPTYISPITLCQNQVASPLTASGSSLKWYSTSTLGIGLITAPTPSTTTAATTNYYVSQTVDGCESARGNIAVMVNPTPVVPTISSVVNPTCTIPSGSLQLNNLPTTSWTVIRTPALVSGTEIYNNSISPYPIDNLAPGTYSFTVSNGLCTSAATSSVTINPVPTQPAPTVGIPVQPSCTVATGSVTLTNLPDNWTLTPNIGLAFPVSGSSTTISGLATGTHNFTVKNVSSDCVSIASSNVVIGDPPFTPSAPKVNPQFFITGDKVSDLRVVNTGSLGTIKWYSSQTGLTVLNPLTTLTSGNYYASEIIGSCESSRTLAIITVDPPTNAGIVNAVGVSTLCSGDSADLILSGQLGSVLKWQSSSDNSTWNDIPNTSGTITYKATNLTSPLYFFRAVVQSSVSSILYSTPTLITVNTPSNAGTLSATNNGVCRDTAGGLLTLNTSTKVGKIVKWQQSINDGISWSDISNVTDTYNAPALSLKTKFRVEVKNGLCLSAFSNIVEILVKDTPTVTDEPNQEICFGETKIFGDNFVEGNEYSLTSNSGYSSALNKSTILFDAIGTQTFTYKITNTNTGCSVQDQFQVTTNALPAAAVIGITAICEGNTINIGANSINGSTYSWSSMPTGFISGIANPIVSPAISTTYSLVETNATGCTKSSDVIVIVQQKPIITIVGSPQFHICETTTETQIQSSAINYIPTSVVWSKVIGSGTFDFTNILNPKYSPSTADIALGSVKLRLTVTGNGPCAQTYSQDLEIIIDKKPIANAGSDVTTCGTNAVTMDASSTQNATSLNWSIVSNGITGILDSSNPYKPSFTPSTSDINYVGPIIIKLEANSLTSCLSSSYNVSVLITKPPVVDAGPATASICEGTAYSISTPASSASNVILGSLNWVTGGDGSFSNLHDLNTVYTPGTADVIAGFAVLTLSGTGNSPCFTPATDTVILTIVKKPTVDLGVDKIVCQGPVNIYSNIQNAGTIQWTIDGGSGSFVDSTVSSPIYNPDPVSDKGNNITFTVKVTPKNACGLDVTKSVIYKINATPVVIAGGNSTICETQTTFNVTSTTNYTDSVIWTSTGTGSFDNPNSKDATYTFSPGDITAGSVIFTIRGDKYNCPSVTDAMTVTIRKNPITNITSVNSICQGETVFFTATASNSSSVNWTKESGSGTINNSNTLFASYVSNPNESGTVNFRIEAQATAPCNIPSNFFKTVTIVAKPTADAGISDIICEGDDYTIGSTASASNYSGLNWTSSSSSSVNGGIFIGGTTLNPIYRPGLSDINLGSVRLKLTSITNQPCSTDVTDEMILTITKNPIITSLEESLDVCTGVGVPVPLNGVDLGIHASNFDKLSWNSSSSLSSGFSKQEPLTTDEFNSYTPSADDIAYGSVNLTLLAIRNLGCNNIVDKIITLNFIKIPVANAGPDTTICVNGNYTPTSITANAENQTSVIWTSNGSPNTIVNPTLLTGMIYTPSQADKDSDSVTLTLTAYGAFCQPKVTDDVVVSFEKLPEIILPTDTSICESSTSYPITSANVIDGGKVTWSSDGIGGSFSNYNLANTTYYPSAADKTRGFVNLTLTAEATAECSSTTPLFKTFKLTFIKLPTVSAGSDINSCDLQFKVLNATATNYSAIQWTASGTGSLDMSSIDKLEAIYNPLTGQTGSVTLTLEVTPLPECISLDASGNISNIISDSTLATFIAKPIITAIPQAGICADSPNTTINGTTITDALSYEWTSTTGTTIPNKNDREPSIIASATDILNGYIDLTITAKPNVPCVDNVSKIVRVEIKPLATITVTNDLTLCMIDANDDGLLDPKTLSATFTDRDLADTSSILWEIVSGKGSLTVVNSTTPVFQPATDTDEVKIRVSVKNVTPCAGVVFKEFTLKAVQKPVVTLLKGTDTVCSSALTYNLTGNTVLDPSNRIEWTRVTPSGTGNFGNLTTANTTYTFSDEDRNNGSVTLRLTAYADPLCSTLSTSEDITITIDKAPTVTITSPLIICAGEPYTATAANPDGNTLAWIEINGNHGTFVNGTSDTATFNQTPNNSSDFEIQLTSNTTTACAAKVVTQMITVQPKPTIDAGASVQYNCSSQPFVISGVTGTQYDSVLWTIDGTNSSDGFSDKTILNPTFTPTPAQITASSVVLKITAKSKSPCGITSDVWDRITLNFTPNQTVSFIVPSAICEEDTISLVGTAPNSSSYSWSTSSTTATNGFDYPTALNSVYTPSALDKTLGKVTLTLTGITNSNCPIATESIEILIKKKPTANAGAPVSICQGTVNYIVNDATAANYDPSVLTNINWTLTGPATIASGTQNQLNPTIVPTPGAFGEIVLTLSVTGFTECNSIAVSTKTITIVPPPVITIPPIKTICEGTTLALTSTDISVTNSSSILWTASPGTFSPTNAAATIYTPAAGQTGLVNLNLTANGIGGVCSSVSKTIALTIIPKPVVKAGADGTICQTGTFTVSDASIQNNYTSYTWGVSGPAKIQTGTENSLTPVIQTTSGATGTAIVTLTAIANSACPVPVSDNFTVLINPAPIVNAGPDDKLCEGLASYQLNSSVINASAGTTYVWNTTGSGTIQPTLDPLQPIYIPGGNDFNSSTGVKVIRFDLVANSTNGCAPVTDFMELTIYAKPIVSAGPDIIDVCEGTSVVLSGANAQNYSSVTWNKSIGSNGIFDFTSITVNPTYSLGSADTSSVTLTISALPNAACALTQVAATDAMTIFINKKPSIVASQNETTMCAETFTLPDFVTISDAGSILWTTGTATPGVLSNATTETPIFTPSADEIAFGFVNLKLTAYPKTGCSGTVETVIKVNLQPKAKISPLGGLTKCITTSPITLNFGALVESATTFYWTENGSGTITANANALQPTYTPGPGETGDITFTLHATNLFPCTGETTATVKLSLIPQPTVNAGTDATVCNGTPYNLLNANATNSSTILWEAFTSIARTNPADGGFNSNSIENPTYTPGTIDKTRGSVYLFMKATNSCSIVDDYMVLTIAPEVGVIYAGASASICEGTTSYSLQDATADNATSYSWTSSDNINGSSSSTYVGGSFNTDSILKSIYSPSPNDVALGYVYLTLKGTGSSTCPIDTSVMKLNITKKPTVSASDIQMCISNTTGVALNGTGTNYNTLVWSKISGPASGYINSGSYFTGLPSSYPTNEEAKLRLVATPLTGCTVNAVKEITINIQSLPIVDAGINGAICYVPGQQIAPFSIIGSSVSNESSSTWATLSPSSGVFIAGTPVIYRSYSNSCTPETLTLTANGKGACSASVVSDAISLEVNCTPPSLGTITGPSTLCQGTSSVLYTVAIDSNIQTYNWQVPTGAKIVLGQGSNSITVNYGANAVSGTISVNGINGCGTGLPSTLGITLNQRPTTAIISGPQIVCAGTSNTYTASSISNADSYKWTLPDGSNTTTSLLTSANPNTISIPATSSGNLSVTGFSNSCGLGDASANYAITVVPLPTLTSLAPSPICSNSVFNYTPDSSDSGATITWTRLVQGGISNAAGSGNGLISETLLNTSTAVVYVIYEITMTTVNGCTKSETITVTVNPIPSLTSGTPPTAICSNGTFSYAPTSDSSGDIIWSRATVPGISQAGANGTISSTNLNISEILTNTTSSPITISYVLTLPANANNCTGPNKIINLIVNPSPNVTPPISQVLCEGDSLGVNFVTTNSGGISSFDWTNNNTIIGLAASGSGSIPTFTMLNPSTTNQVATISVTPWFTNGGISCSGTPQTFNITVNPTADVNQPSNQVICNGSNTNAIVFETTNTTGTTTYAWTNDNPSIGLIGSGNGTIASFTVTNTTTIPQVATIVVTPTYTEGGKSCTGLPKTFTITVNPSANVAQPISPLVCANSLVSSIFTTTNTIGTTTYTWTNTNANIGLASSGTSSITSFTALNSGTLPEVATVVVTPTFTNAGQACLGASKTFTITVNPSAQVNPISNITKCKGDIVNVIVFSTANTIGTTTYSWANSNPSIGLGASGLGDIPSFTVSNSGTTVAIATITVTPTFTYNGTSCTGPVQVFTITVNPGADMIQPVNKVVCNGESTSINFTTANTGGTTTYDWSSDIAIGMPALSGSGSITNFTAINTGSSPIVATITVTPTFTNGGVSCVGLPKTFTISVNPSADVNQPVTPLVLCNGTPTSVNFTTNNIGGTTTYTWTNNTPSIGISTTGTGSIATFPITNLGTAPLTANLSVTPTFANAGKTCSGVTKNFTITINPTAQLNQPIALVKCIGETTSPIVFTTQNTVGTITYTWTNDNTSIGLIASGTGDIPSFTTENTGTSPQVATIVVTPTFTNDGVVCTGPTKTFTITVNPAADVSQPTSLIRCNGDQSNVTFSTANSGGATSYSWTNSATSIGLGATGFGSIPTFTPTNTGNTPVVSTLQVTPTFTNTGKSCSGLAKTFTITVNPSAQVDQPISEVVCNGSSTTAIVFSSSYTSGVTTFAWTNSNVSIGLAAFGASSIPSFTGINTGNTPQVATIVVTPTYTNAGVSCTGPSKTYTITVNPSPQVNQPTAQVICNGDTYSFNFTSANTGGTTTYIWENSNTAIGLTATSGSGFIPSFTATNTGLVPSVATITVTPTYSNGGVSCSGLPKSFTITVNPSADVIQPVSQVVCNSGSTAGITLSSLNNSGTTSYTWTNSNTSIGLPISGTGALIPSFNAVNTGNIPVVATITVTPTYNNAGVNCAGPSKTFTITVNPTGELNQPTPQVVCNGSATTLVNFSSNNSGGATTYSWTNNNTTIGLLSIGSGAIPSFNAVNTGTTPVVATIVVTPTFTNAGQACSGTPKIFTITVNPSAELVQPLAATFCNGDTSNVINFSSLNSVGITTYTWTNSNTSIGLVLNGSGSIPSFTAINSGTSPITSTVVVTPVYTNGGQNCSGSTKTFVITVNPSAEFNQPISQELCNGTTTTAVNFNTVNTGGTTTYSWTNSNTTIGLGANGSGNILPFTVNNSGATPQVATITVTATYTNSGKSCATTKTFTITVHPSPKATISGLNSFIVCQNDTQPSVTFIGSSGTPPYIFEYKIGIDNFTISSSGTSSIATVSVPTINSGDYIVTLLSVKDSSNSACTSNSIILPNEAFVMVQEQGSIIPVLSSSVSQTSCQGIPINPIVFSIEGSAKSAFVTNLPAGLNGVFNSVSSQLTISGTPSTPGIYNYIVTTSGSLNGCNSTYSGGTITVNSNDVITLLTPTSSIQNVCASAPIQPIAYNLGGGATGGTVTFSPHQPAGISWNLVSNVITITGSTSEVGTFTYTVNSFGICDPTTYSGTIEIKENATVKLVSENASPTVCIDIPLGTPLGTAIEYSITSTTSATMVLTGVLPKGVSFSPTTGLFSGTPGESGSFPYTISSSTTCGNLSTGTITVNPLQSISLLSGTINQTACVNSAIDPINFSLSSGVTGVTIVPDFPPGITSIVNNGVLTISGKPTTAQGNKNYIIKTVGSCGPAVTTNISFDIKPEATIVFGSNSGAISQSVCQSTAIKPITFTVGGGATGIEPMTSTTLGGLTLIKDPATGVYTISGNPTANGTFTIPITTTGCVTSETITISNVNTAVSINLTSAIGRDNQTLCQVGFNSPIIPIKYLLIGATGVDVKGLPTGVTSSFNSTSGELTISGTSTDAGIFNYSVTTLPCGIIKTGTLKISTPISITNVIVKDVDCSSINDGAISVTIIGGANSGGLYAINWTGPNGFQQNLTEISGLEAGDYVLSGTDAIGCSIPTMNYTVLGTLPINISLASSTNVSCNGVLGSANFDITGGSGIYPPNTAFKLQYLDPSSQTLVTIIPANYYNIKNLKAGLYYLTVVDSKNCSTAPYLFSIYDYSTLKIDAVSLDSTLCADTAGKVRVTVTSLDDNLVFYYNNTLVSNVNLGNSIYELSITNPTIPYGVIKVVNSQNCSDTETVSTSLMEPDLDFTSLNLETNKIVSVNESVRFTNGLTNSTIPAEYNYVVWDFGDNSPYKVFYNPTDVVPNSLGESITTVFHTYAIDGLFPVTFTAYNSFGCSKSITKIVTVGEGASIIVPTAFSPNQDGINDLFRPMLLGLKEVNMYIYDSSGNLVYEISSETDLLPIDWGWNGIEKTRNTPINGTYRYYIISKTIDDKTIEKAGQFILIK